ncbi:MAG: MurR/RpiR family transcriptional regulator, partial [Eubacteriales bacterium]|nr:MurR/RpiR family transcriptional regulator [Eubacteriales bacterium]
MVSSFLSDIQLSYNQFTRTERKIADYVIKNCDKVVFMSISDLSEACRVADASVYRFCRTMGVKGYQEFKMKLSLSLASEDAGKAGEPKDVRRWGLEYILDEVLEKNVNAMRETRRLANYEEIEKTIRMMEEAKRIYFFGIGDSLLMGQLAVNKFLRITKKVNYISDLHMQAMMASMASEEDLIIFLSYSGSTKDNISVARIAKESGAKIAVISRFMKTPLTAYMDTLLLCGSDEGPLEGGSMGARASQMFIIDVLFHEYYRR